MATDEVNRRVIQLFLDPTNVTATTEEILRMADYVASDGVIVPVTSRNPRPNPKECPKCLQSKTPPT